MLARPAEHGLLEPAWEAEQPAGRPRRHLYRLTPEGASLAAEVESPHASARRSQPVVGRPVRTSRERRQWLISAHIYAIKQGRMTWLRLAVSSASILFILWIAYNAVDSRFAGTGPEIASAIALVVLLTVTVAIVTPRRLLNAVVSR